MSLILTPGQFTQRAELYHQLAQLTAAGIGVVRALEQLERNPPGRSFRKPLQQLLASIKEGRTFTDSLQHTANWLPEFEIALISAGERSGRMDSCFRILSDYYHDRARVTKQVISQLAYPVGLVHFAAFIFMVVLPFAASQFNASLLLLFVKTALFLSPLYFGTALIIYVMQSKHGERWRALMEKLLRFVPLLGVARRDLALSRLAVALEALINAGVNIIEAWDLAAAASGSPALRRVVNAWRPQVEAGRTPAEVVSASREFPEMFANFYASGEISGQLDDSLQRLHRYYNETGTNKLQAFAQWTPRLIYFCCLLVIAYKIIQFYTGYFNQISAVTNGI